MRLDSSSVRQNNKLSKPVWNVKLRTIKYGGNGTYAFEYRILFLNKPISILLFFAQGFLLFFKNKLLRITDLFIF